MRPIELGIHRQVALVNRSCTPGADVERWNLKRRRPGVPETDLKIHDVEPVFFRGGRKHEALCDFQAIGRGLRECDLALGAVGAHFKSAVNIARIKSQRPDRHPPIAVQ